MVLPIRIRPSIPLSQFIPSGSFIKPLFLLHQRAERMKKHSHRKLTNLISWTIALSESVKLWAMQSRATQEGWSWWRVLTKCGPLEKGMTNHFSILALRTPWTVWKGKNIGHWKMNCPGWQVPNKLLEMSGEITLERMKRQSQSKNNIQLWMWLVIEARFDAVKSNIA